MLAAHWVHLLSICAVDPVQVMQFYADFTGDHDGVETVQNKTRGKCWDGGLPLMFHGV